MPLVAAYHRPHALEDAVALLAEPRRVVLAGGTVLNADREPSDLEAVDLQDCELDTIESTGDRLRLGSMATLDAVARHDLVPAPLARVARAELPSSLRTLATVGGTVAVAEAESLLLAAFLAHDAIVELAPDHARTLADVLTRGVPVESIILAVTLDRSGETAVAVTARTPTDSPIVGVYGRSSASGLEVAVSGVADVPVLVDPTDPTSGLDPAGDFRGSAEYRVELARVLVARVVEDLRR